MLTNEYHDALVLHSNLVHVNAVDQATYYVEFRHVGSDHVSGAIISNHTYNVLTRKGTAVVTLHHDPLVLGKSWTRKAHTTKFVHSDDGLGVDVVVGNERFDGQDINHVLSALGNMMIHGGR